MTEQETKAMLEAMKKDKEGSGERKFWSPPSKEEGTWSLRILPPLKKLEELKFYFTHKVHWIDGTPYECLNQSLTDKNGNYHEASDCPVCKFAKKLYKASSKGDDEFKLAGEINAKQRRVSRVIVRGSDDETKPVFYEYGPTIFNMLFHIMNETDFGIIVDPKNGRDFNLTKVGTGRRSSYETSTPSANISPIFTDAASVKKVFENAMAMKYTDLIEFTTYEVMEKVLKEYLGIDEATPAQATPAQATPAQATPAQATPAQATPEQKSGSEEESEIDNILDEFAN